MSAELNNSFRQDPRTFLQDKALAVKTPEDLQYHDLLAGQAAESPVGTAVTSLSRDIDAEEDSILDDADELSSDDQSRLRQMRAQGERDIIRSQWQGSNWKRSVVTTATPVLYADISMGGDDSAQKYRVSFTRDGGDDRIKCYFLPWRPNQTTHMTLGDDADYFFTATLDGCSVYIIGPESNPTVYHGNASSLNDPSLKNEFMDRLVTLTFFKGLVPRQVSGKSAVPAISKASYEGPAAGFGKGSDDDRDFPNFNGGGNVFGFREEGRWRFYFQTYVVGTHNPERYPLQFPSAPFFERAITSSRRMVGVMIKACEPLWPKGSGRVSV